MLGFRTTLLCTLLSLRVVNSVPLSRRSGNLTNALDITSVAELPGDKATLIATICGQDPGADGIVSGAYNRVTGEFMTYVDYLNSNDAPLHWSNHYGRIMGAPLKGFEAYIPWEVFTGTCSWEMSATWDWQNTPIYLGDPISNAGTGAATESFSHEYTTSIDTIISIQVPSYMFTTQDVDNNIVGAATSEALTNWSFPSTTTVTIEGSAAVAPNTTAWMTFEPTMRTIRLNPVFHVITYTWATKPGTIVNFRDGTDPVTVNSWCGLGWQDVYSSDYYIDGVANVLNGGTPAGTTQYPFSNGILSSSTS